MISNWKSTALLFTCMFMRCSNGHLYARKDNSIKHNTVQEVHLPLSLTENTFSHHHALKNDDTDRFMHQESKIDDLSQNSEEQQPDNLGHVRKKRDVDSHTGHPYISSYSLHDNHTNAFISWAGTTPKMVVLTRSSGSKQQANIYVSNDYGKTFRKQPSLSATLSNGTTVQANPGFLYHAGGTQTSERSMTSYIFVDQSNKIVVSTRDLQTFQANYVGFSPYQLTFSPNRDDILLCLGLPEGSTRTTNLYISDDFGATWSILKSRASDYSWGWMPDQVFAIVSTFFGILFDNSDVVELTYDGSLHQRTMITAVNDFEIKGAFLFAVKSRRLIGSSTQDLYVSKNGSAFRQAEFPVIANYTNKEYFIVDADNDRVMVCVNHDIKSSHLYVSDTSGTRYTLSLPNIVYVSPGAVAGTSLPGIRFYDEPFVDIHKVDGLRGIYIASQFLTNRTTDRDLADTNQTTRITYDKGGVWTHIVAPALNKNGRHTYCFWYAGCTLHLLQDFLFGSNYRVAPILSEKNAIGLVMGSGVLGYTLKQETTPSVFLSTDAGFTWSEVQKGNYTYNFGDHGNLIVMLEPRKPIKTLLYSHDEGQSWTNYTFTHEYLTVYGLLTEPGSKSGNFSIWASKSGGNHSWEIVHLNLLTIFNNTICQYSDYKMWYPGVNVSSKEICLLGAQDMIERKKPSSFCINGGDYERWYYNYTCKCVRSDYECDYGFRPKDVSESLWDPRPSSERAEDTLSECVRDEDVANITTGKPVYCPYGTTYNATIGYRKIPGDVCEGGMDHLYDIDVRQCPPDNNTDFMIYSTGTSIYRFDLQTQRTEFIVRGSSVSEIYSIAFDYHRDILFWANQDSDSVMYYNMSNPGSPPLTLVSGDTGKIECIALDWESDNIYLVDSRQPKIELFATWRNFRRTIVTNNNTNPRVLEKPRALDIVPNHGVMFWTDWSTSNPRVMRSTMSGFNISTLINGTQHHLVWPNGLAVDPDNELVYVIDGNTHKLVVVKFDGTNYNELLTNANQIKHPYSLAFINGRLYWSDWEDDRLKSVLASSGQGFLTHLSGFSSRIMAIKALNWDKQYVAGVTGCGRTNTSNGACSNICVPQGHPDRATSQNRVCLCPDISAPQPYITGMSERNCSCPAGETFNQLTGYCDRVSGSTCPTDEFQCKNNTRCISAAWVCDHDNDCGDLSDEINCDSVLCDSSEYLCVNTQRCIDRNWLCDGDNDCGDYSDEHNCVNITCNDYQFRCDNNRCIPSSYQCDNENDCGPGDTSDERNCTHQNATCDSEHFPCVSTRFHLSCIPNTWLCDGEEDCDNGLDEQQNCSKVTTCTADQFKCSQNDTRCLPNSWICDGYPDCFSGSDEVNCTYTTLTPPSAGTTPKAGCLCNDTYGRCVGQDARCDGHIDCPYGWDEYGCDYNTTDYWWTTTELPTLPPCIGYPCSNRLTCITPDKICDGANDCHPLHEDETNCNQCHDGMVPCALNSKQCIDSQKVCDGHNDCFNGTDEMGCAATGPTTPSLCPGGFQCKTSKLCINSDLYCNDRYDCFDGSDEEGCDKTVTIARVSLTDRTNSSASFSWTVTGGTVPAGVSFLVQYLYVTDVHAHTNVTNWVNGTTVKVRNATVTGLQPFTNYRFRVRALVTRNNKQLLGVPSNELHMSTLEGLPGPVGNLQGYLVGDYIEAGRWQIKFRPPRFPNGVINSYYYEVYVSTNPIPRARGAIEPELQQGSDYIVVDINVNLDLRDLYTAMTIKVWAYTSVGRGSPANTTHCFTLPTPEITCSSISSSIITTGIELRNFEVAGYKYSIHLTYHDVDKVEHNVITPVVNTDQRGFFRNVTQLTPGTEYTFVVTFERSTSLNQLDCASAARQAQCSTKGTPPARIQGLQITSTAIDGFALSWTKDPSATQYKIVLSTNRDELVEGVYEHTYTSNTNSMNINGLGSCSSYFVAVKMTAPYNGPLSNIVQVSTQNDEMAGPHQVKIDDGPHKSIEHLLWEQPIGDPASVNISWSPTCNPVNLAYKVYLLDYSPGNQNISTEIDVKGQNYYKFDLQRGGAFVVTIANGNPGGKNSSSKLFSPDPYEAPTITLVQSFANHTKGADIFYRIQELSGFEDGPPTGVSGLLNLQYKVNNGEYKDMGYIPLKWTGSCKVPLIQSQTNYTVRIRYARLYNGRYYHGSYGSSWIYMSQGAPAPTPAPHTNPQGGKLGMWVGIGVSLVVVLVLTVLLGVWCIRHRRLQRSFMEFTSSRYNSRTDNATFSGDGDDDDSPMIQGFSDDEPLVIA